MGHGANVNGTGGDGRTILAKATDNGRREVVKSLLAHGAGPSLPVSDGRTALDAALARDDTELVALFRAAPRSRP